MFQKQDWRWEYNEMAAKDMVQYQAFMKSNEPPIC
jgi:hypothetical protein